MAQDLQFNKARISCSNGLRVADNSGTRRNAAIRLLPNNAKKASACKMQLPNGLHVFAHTSPKISKSGSRNSQDALTIINHGEYSLFSAIDGFGELGNFLPRELSGVFPHFLFELKNKITNENDAADFLIRCSKLALSHIDNNLPGGAAAILAIGLPERRFMISSVEDCGCFLIGSDGSVTRLLDYNRVVLESGPVSLSDIPVDMYRYSSRRRVVMSPIDADMLLPDSVRHPPTLTSSLVGRATIQLGQGESLLLSTDGILKNLYVDVEGIVVTDVSGSADLEKIIDGRKGASLIGKSILSEFKKRARRGRTESRIWHPDDKQVLLPADDDCGFIVVSSES